MPRGLDKEWIEELNEELEVLNTEGKELESVINQNISKILEKE